MTVTIHLSPELEHQLRQAAAEAGLALDSFILRSVEERLEKGVAPVENGRHLPPRQAELLLQINNRLSSFPWERYRELIARRQDESLTASEQTEITDLSDQVEAANAERLTLLAELAHLRNTSLSALMADLGLRSPSDE
jgi:hypothetical protein